jgi:hypothetical protein
LLYFVQLGVYGSVAYRDRKLSGVFIAFFVRASFIVFIPCIQHSFHFTAYSCMTNCFQLFLFFFAKHLALYASISIHCILQDSLVNKSIKILDIWNPLSNLIFFRSIVIEEFIFFKKIFWIKPARCIHYTFPFRRMLEIIQYPLLYLPLQSECLTILGANKVVFVKKYHK